MITINTLSITTISADISQYYNNKHYIIVNVVYTLCDMISDSDNILLLSNLSHFSCKNNYYTTCFSWEV